MNENNIRNKVLTEIMQQLGSHELFTDIVYKIFESSNQYLDITNLLLLQINPNGTKVNSIVEYHKEGMQEKHIIDFSLHKLCICSDHMLVIEKTENGEYNRRTITDTKLERTNSSAAKALHQNIQKAGQIQSVQEADRTEQEQPENAQNENKKYENESGLLKMHNYADVMTDLAAKRCVTVPVYINDMLAMHVVIMDSDKIQKWSESELQFISNVTNVIQCIAQKKVTSSSLLSSYEVLKEILNNIGTGISVCTQNGGDILFENKLAAQSEEIRRTIKECVKVYFDETVEDNGKPMEFYDSESGLWFEVKFADLTWIDGSQVVICTAEDITQKKKNQQKIEYQAHNDFLTGLYNRMKCEHDLRKVIKQTIRIQKKGAVLFMDLDDFKHINDGLGHQYGDILLQQISAGLQSVPGLRGNCYRMGGDEFVIIIPPNIFHDLDKIIKSIINMFNKPWYLMETEYFCTMSMGVATFPDKGTDVNELIKNADIAMYEAKKAGKNRYNFYTEDYNSRSYKRLDIENNMRMAIASECDEFVVFYQPVIDTANGKCVSCEALVRWDSKVLGFMGPGDFIPLAEYLGLITSIGDFVLEEACRQCKIWNENGYPEFRVNVNLSVVQLLQKDVAENVRKILVKTGVNPKNIVLEITESFAINDMERVMKIIDGLKKLGPQIALDDFGTGYSSLNYIKQLPLDIIKVDKTFIDDIVDDDYAQAFVKLIVDLSKTIGTRICVEGVEKGNQYQLLRNLGVDYIQGYYFGKPVDAATFYESNLRMLA